MQRAMPSEMTGPTMADAIKTARQIVKTHDDCLCEGADMATLVSRIEAHVLAYVAEREILLAEADACIAADQGELVGWGTRSATMLNLVKWQNDALDRYRARNGR